MAGVGRLRSPRRRLSRHCSTVDDGLLPPRGEKKNYTTPNQVQFPLPGSVATARMLKRARFSIFQRQTDVEGRATTRNNRENTSGLNRPRDSGSPHDEKNWLKSKINKKG